MRTAFLIGVVALAGCAIATDVPPQVQERLAKLPLALSEVDTGRYQLFVTKAALTDASEFLLSTSVVLTSQGEPSFSGGLSQVVFFKRADGNVQMLESLKSNTIDASLVKPRIVASFPVVSENDTAVGLGFNEGAASFLDATDWDSSDSPSAMIALNAGYRSVPLTQRYVDEGKTDASGRITIRQVARISSDTLELRYFLRPYTPDPNYSPLVSHQDFRRVGYFESAPVRVAGAQATQRFLSRFNPASPLRYAISANTPDEVKQAMRDAILYWNRALGREWIQVVDAPAGVTAPDLDYNLVQWVAEKAAPFAYADAQLDPLTGKVENAQVYFPSAWYDSAGLYIARAWAQHEDDPADPQTADAAAAANGGTPATESTETRVLRGACDRVDAGTFAQAARSLMKRDLTQEQMKRIALDWVRSVLSHEIGHTLGLRHNFAGSLGSNLDPSEVDALSDAYFESGDWPADKLPSSSVMEYPAFEDDVAIGARIRLGLPALPYDVMAIHALYDGAQIPEDGPLFCTDSEVGMLPDCQKRDTGADLVATLHKQIKDSPRDAAAQYLFSLIAPKLNGRQDLFAQLRVKNDVSIAYRPRYTFAQLISTRARTLRADRAIGSPSVRAAEIHQDALKRAGESIRKIGGYEDFFALLPEDFDAVFSARLNELLAQPWSTSGTSEIGMAWSFSEKDLEQIRAYVPTYLEQYHDAAALADIATLSLQDPGITSSVTAVVSAPTPIGATPITPTNRVQWQLPAFADEFDQLLAARIQHYVLSTSGELTAKVAVGPVPPPSAAGAPAPAPAPITPAPSTPSAAGSPPMPRGGASAPPPVETPTTFRTLVLPVFTYPTEARRKAPGLLSPSLSALHVWAYDLRKTIPKPLHELLDAAAGGSFNALKILGTDEDAQQWILDNRDVLSAVDGVPLRL